MAINYPSGPTEGQKFTNGTTVYTFSSGVWAAEPLGTALPFNYVVNPQMKLSQQNGQAASATTTGLTYAAADQWMTGWGSPGNMMGHSYTPAVSEGIVYPSDACVIYSAVALAAFTTTQNAHIYQFIEGNRVADFHWGWGAAEPAVLRFCAMAPSAGTYAVKIGNQPQTRSWCGSFTLNAADTWQEFTVAIPGDTTGTYPLDHTGGFLISWGGGWGPTYAGAAGWNAGAVYAAPGTQMAWRSLAGYFRIGKVGLYRDPLNTGRAPPWECVHEQRAQSDSLRYWCKYHSMIGVSNGANASRGGGYNTICMRAGPSMALIAGPIAWDQAASAQVMSITGNYGNAYYGEIDATTNTTLTTGRPNFWPPDGAPTTRYAAASARF